jgi:hypothetical protein
VSTDGVVSTKIGAIIGAVADVSGGMARATHSGGGSVGNGKDVCRLGGVGRSLTRRLIITNC